MKQALLKQAALAISSRERSGRPHTKTRGEVRGGGRKPWRQKGTGRARAGSIRSPIWVGGGVAFGPRKNRNFTKHLPKKMAQLALGEALSLLMRNKKITTAPSLSLPNPKTKTAGALLRRVASVAKKPLLVTAKVQPELILAGANLQGARVTTVSELSLADLLRADYVVLEQAAHDQLFAKKGKTTR